MKFWYNAKKHQSSMHGRCNFSFIMKAVSGTCIISKLFVRTSLCDIVLCCLLRISPQHFENDERYEGIESLFSAYYSHSLYILGSLSIVSKRDNCLSGGWAYLLICAKTCSVRRMYTTDIKTSKYPGTI